jgi:hypothetical protein
MFVFKWNVVQTALLICNMDLFIGIFSLNSLFRCFVVRSGPPSVVMVVLVSMASASQNRRKNI